MTAATPSVEQAGQFLTDRYGPGTTDVAPLGAGDWSRAFSFRLDGRDLVARFGVHLEDFEKDRKAVSFSSVDLPVPEVLEVGEGLGGHYAISQRHFGTFLEELDGPGWRRLMPSLLRALDALRDLELPAGTGVDWAAGDGDGDTGWRDWLTRSLQDNGVGRTGGWRARMASESAEVFAAGEAALAGLLPFCPEGRHVIHRDLLNRNVLASPDGSRLEAVFDWGCSVAGDFVYEVAWFTFWSFWFPALDGLDFAGAVQSHYDSAGLAVEHFDERLRCYEIHIGLEHIAYATFTGREDYVAGITRRTAEILAR